MADDQTILLCAAKGTYSGPPVEGSVEDICVDCNVVILRKPDPEVPDDAVHLCMSCGLKRMAESEEVPTITITRQNQEMLDRLGYKPRTEGSC